MRSLARTLQILVALLLCSMVCASQTDWKGSYYFGEDGGKNTGGTAVLISHDLEIFEGDADALMATLQSNGYQTSADLLCTARVSGSKLMIFFESYGESNMFEPYKQGDLLFTLEQKIVKGAPMVFTYWGKFMPAIPRNNKSGKVYFERTTQNKL